MSKRVTLQNIADKAGVTRMTVSFALRNSPQVSESTRRRIKALARRLGYRADPEVVRYMEYLRRTRPADYKATIGFLNYYGVPGAFRTGGFFSKILKGAIQRAAELGYEIDEIWAGDPAVSPRRLKQIIAARGIDSIIVPPLPDDTVRLSLDCADLHGAAIAFTLEEPGLPRVTHAHFEGARTALHQVQELGYRRPGFVSTTRSNLRVRGHWLGGFLSGTINLPRGGQLPPCLLPSLESTQLNTWLEEWRPDVIISPHPQIFGAVTQLGLKIPQQIGFVLLDAAAGEDAWAGIDQHVPHLGAAAVDLVIAQRNRNEPGVPDLPRTIMIEGAWRMGSTVRRVQSTDPGR